MARLNSVILLYSSQAKEVLTGWGGGVAAGRITFGVTPKNRHHQLSRRLSEKEVFAFSLAAANRVSPPLCLRLIPPFSRYPISQLKAVDVPNVGQSATSCYVGGRIDKREGFFPLSFLLAHIIAGL